MSELVLSSIMISSITCISVIFLIFPIVSSYLNDIFSKIIREYYYTVGREDGFKSVIRYDIIPKKLFNRDVQRTIEEIEKKKRELREVYLGKLPTTCLFAFSISLVISAVLLLLPASTMQLLESLLPISFLVGIILFITIGAIVTMDVMYVISIKQEKELKEADKDLEKYKKSNKFKKWITHQVNHKIKRRFKPSQTGQINEKRVGL
jgi:hypothetical protein